MKVPPPNEEFFLEGCPALRSVWLGVFSFKR